MKNFKRVQWLAGILALIAALIVVIVLHEPHKGGISRAMAAKAVALAASGQEALQERWQESGTSRFPAEALEQWYVPYMDFMYDGGYLAQENTPADEKTAEGALTYSEAEQIASAVDPMLASRVRATKKNWEKPFPEEAWWLLYDEILKRMDPEGTVREEEMVIYGTVDIVKDTPPWSVHTSLGQMKFTGLSLDAYADHQLKVLVRGSEIIRLLEDQGTEVVWRNVWVISGGEDGMEVFVGDIRREVPFRKKTKNAGDLVHNLADIQMEDGKVVKVSVKKERIAGKVLSVQEDAVEIEGYGLVPLDGEYKVLKTYGDLTRQELSDILVGYDNQEFVVAKGKICAVLTVRDFDAETIRVLLMDENYQSIFHDHVTLVCDGGMTLLAGEEESVVSAGETLEFAFGDERLQGGRLILRPADGCEIRLCSLNRSQGQPCYGGRLELLDTADGLVLINELYLEDYLKKVVPSEMPSYYEKEALKAQAVCARTYAYMQLQSNTYSQYGAHIDDSTNFQVYNNIETDEKAAAAVEETYGKMLLYNGNPISAYYFSTSCGTTTDGSVWGADPEDTPYLRSIALQPGKKTLDLQDNDKFSAFIRRTDMSAYDSSSPFFRWRVTVDENMLTAKIGGIGQVQGLSVVRRGAGGVALELLVKGSEGEKTISGQNAIRAALGDQTLKITRKDGEVVEGWSSLPSAFLTVEPAGTNDQGCKLFQIYGGGYGHGAGMSQNGAQGMAKSGMSCEEILKFFYRDVTVEEKKNEETDG